MDEQKYITQQLDIKIKDIDKNLRTLLNNCNKNNLLIEKVSNLADINEMFDLINEKILEVNDKIESDSLSISEQAIKRLQNNKIVLQMLEPFLPYMITNLVILNTT